MKKEEITELLFFTKLNDDYLMEIKLEKTLSLKNI